MHITYAGHHIEVTPALRAYAEGKLNKLTHHSEHITAVHVIFTLEKLSHIVEATVSLSKAEIHAQAASNDMYAAIDALIDKLDRQLVKHKEKRHNHRE